VSADFVFGGSRKIGVTLFGKTALTDVVDFRATTSTDLRIIHAGVGCLGLPLIAACATPVSERS
jgi:hypothetical protein